MWILFLNLIVLSTFNMAKPQNNQTLNCHSVYDYMTEKEQDVVYEILERIYADKDWDMDDICWDLIIQEDD